jgi:integrase
VEPDDASGRFSTVSCVNSRPSDRRSYQACARNCSAPDRCANGGTSTPCAGEVRLDPDITKNQEGRTFPLTDALRMLLTEQKALMDTLKASGVICPWVFHRHGKPIRDFRDAWEAARKAAGCPGRLVHDLRRTAVRNLVRAGVPQTVAMKMTGHKTDSVFRRYDIASPDDLRVAAERLNAAAARGDDMSDFAG